MQRLAVQVGGLPVQLAQVATGRVDHQVLGAFGGCALAAGLLARAVAELLRAPSPLTMLLGTWSGHDHTVLRTAAVRYKDRQWFPRRWLAALPGPRHIQPRYRIETEGALQLVSGWPLLPGESGSAATTTTATTRASRRRVASRTERCSSRKPSTVEGALRAERYVARAVSQPRFAQTSSVAAALFIV